jgi:hypothetical protein
MLLILFAEWADQPSRELSLVWPGYSLPFYISRSYTLPEYVSSKSLVIVSSYSGNTEEAVSSFEDAVQKGANIVVMSAGGQLAKLAEENKCTYVGSGLQPGMRHCMPSRPKSQS